MYPRHADLSKSRLVWGWNNGDRVMKLVLKQFVSRSMHAGYGRAEKGRDKEKGDADDVEGGYKHFEYLK